jgi:thymidylate synthase
VILLQQFTVNDPYDGFVKIFNHVMNKRDLFVSEDNDQSYLGETVCIHINNPLKNHDKLINVSCQGKQSFNSYYEQLVLGLHIKKDDPDDEATYTYHGRLFEYGVGTDLDSYNVNQIRYIIEKLTESKNSRRAVAVTWQPGKDLFSHDPPCMDFLKFSIKKDRLCLTVVFRSHDVLKAWPQNVYAISRLQEYVTNKIGVGIGWLEIISLDPHVYIKGDATLAKETYHKITTEYKHI